MQQIRSRWWLSPPGLVALLVGALHVAYVVLSTRHNPVRFDSAYNLSVSRNLADGLGYASDGLILRSGSSVQYADAAQALPFDPSISTGPTVLAPLALGFLGDGNGLVVARAVMCLWFLALLIFLALVGRRVAGAWGVPVGLLAPLLIDPAMGLVTEPRGPTEVIGEVPVAALVAAAVWCVSRRPHLAALLVGLAVVTKLVAFLAAPAIVLAGAAVVSRPTTGRVLLRMVSASAVVCAPLLCWQLVIAASLGGAGYRANLDGQIAMFRGAGSGVEGGSQAALHARLLADAWTFPHPVLLAALVGVVVLLTAGAVAGRDALRGAARRLADRPRVLTALTAGAISLPWLGWFVLVSSQSYPRYAYVPLVLGGTLVGALLVRAMVSLAARPAARVPVLVCGVALVGLSAWQVSATLGATARPVGETLTDQREAARVLQATSPDDVFGFVDAAAFVSALAFVADMTAVPAAEQPDRPLFVSGYDLELVESSCDGPPLFQSPTIVVCDVSG